MTPVASDSTGVFIALGWEHAVKPHHYPATMVFWTIMHLQVCHSNLFPLKKKEFVKIDEEEIHESVQHPDLTNVHFNYSLQQRSNVWRKEWHQNSLWPVDE